MADSIAGEREQPQAQQEECPVSKRGVQNRAHGLRMAWQARCSGEHAGPRLSRAAHACGQGGGGCCIRRHRGRHPARRTWPTCSSGTSTTASSIGSTRVPASSDLVMTLGGPTSNS